MSEAGSITDVLTMLDSSIKDYVFSGYAALSSSVSTYLRTALLCYVAFVGWSSTQSWSPMTGGEAIKHVIKMCIVVLLVTNWDFFSLMIYNVATNAPNDLSAILVGATNHDAVSSNEALQESFNKGIELADEIWQKGGVTAPVYYFASAVVLIIDYVSSGFALLEISVAKCGLGVTVVLAPVFAPCLLWEGGKGVFAAWLKCVFGFALLPLILMSVIMLMNPILAKGLSVIEASDLETGWGCLSTFVLGGIACAGLLIKSSMIAANIAGGLSVSTMDAMPAGRMGAGMGKMLGNAGKVLATGGAGLAMKAARWAKNKK
jgi:type IV secretion system protein VirB6